MNQQLIEQIVGEVLDQLGKAQQALPADTIPIAVSARHLHLSPQHVEALFGKGYELTKRSELSQPGQFAANETVVIAGPKGSISQVRVLGPARSRTQVEISWTDAMKLGVRPPIRESGNIENSAPVTIIGPKGSLFLEEGLIIAQSHIHMSSQDAERLNVEDGEVVTVEVDGVRPIAYRNVLVRVSDRFRLEMHIDTDEANAGFISKGANGRLVKSGQPSVVTATDHPAPPPQKTTIHEFNKKLLTNEEVRRISETEILIKKGTIVTALARDTARELGKTISFRN